MATDTVNVGALTIASILGAKMYGISVDDVIIATVPTMMGALGRVGFEVARAADPKSSVKWTSVAYLFGGTLISAPTVSVLGLIVLQLTHTSSDPATLFVFLFAGFIGPKSIIWAFNSISDALNRMFNLKLPKIGAAGQEQSP